MLYLPHKLEAMEAMPNLANQGNPEFNSEQSFIRRERLKQDEHVEVAIRRWWDALVTEGGIDKDHYIAACEEAMLMIDPTGDTEEMLQVALEDWNHDCKSDGKYANRLARAASMQEIHSSLQASQDTRQLSYMQFSHTMFELADLWCPHIDGQEYAAFLDHLYDEVITSHKLDQRLLHLGGANSQGLSRWRLLRHVMETPGVLEHHGGYDAYSQRDAFDPMADELARELLRICDTKERGTCSQTDMSAHLQHTKHKCFLNYMTRRNGHMFKECDTNHDSLLDLDDMRLAVKKYWESDIYGVELRKKQIHPEDTRPVWKVNSPSAHAEYNASADQKQSEAHREMNAAAHQQRKLKNARAAGNSSAGSAPKSARQSMSTYDKSQTRNGGLHLNWLHAKQIAFAVNRVAKVKGVGPPHFREAHNILTDVQRAQAKAVFDTWDKNSDHGISRQELGAAMHAVIESMHAISAQTGGHTTVKVGLEKDDVEAFVQNIFEKADRNHDGDLDEEEFLAIYNTIAINCIDYNEVLTE